MELIKPQKGTNYNIEHDIQNLTTIEQGFEQIDNKITNDITSSIDELKDKVDNDITTAITELDNKVDTEIVTAIDNLETKVNTEISESITALDNKVTTSLQEQAESLKKEIYDQIAKVVANSPEDFDTLKEISDWISGHSSDASSMNTAISGNTSTINQEILDRQAADTALQTNIDNKVDKVNGKELSTNDFTDAYKSKLDGIEVGANKTVVDTALNSTSTNPVQNKVVNTALGNKVDKVSGKGLSTNDYTTAEKNKLAGIEDGANKYILPTASNSTLGGVKTTSTVTSTTGLTPSPIIDGVPYYKNTTYSNATTSTAGLMSATDKSKLDEIISETTKQATLATVSTETTKYIKLGTFSWNDNVSFRCLISGNSFEDSIYINILNGNSSVASVCGHYATNGKRTKAVIVKKGSTYNSNIELYLRISQITTATVKVTINKTYQNKISISESTAAPSGTLETIEFNSANGMFGQNFDITAERAKGWEKHILDLTSLSTSNFYPVVIETDQNFLEVAIRSQGGSAAAAYNQNRIKFSVSAQGWSDTPKSIFISEYNRYSTNETTIGSIGYGVGSFYGIVIWLRGGLLYTCYTMNSISTPSIKTGTTTIGDSTISVGTTYSGGTKSNISIMFTPDSTISSGAYIDNGLKVSGRLTIPTSAPTNPKPGDIWLG